jgi:hypothetical protein
MPHGFQMQMPAPTHREHGFGAAFLLVLLAVAAFGLAALAERGGLGLVRSRQASGRERARYLALAGAEHAVWRLQHEPCFLADEQGKTSESSLDTGKYSYRVTGSRAQVRIEASGSAGTARYDLTRLLGQPPAAAPALASYHPSAGTGPASRRYTGGAWSAETPAATTTDLVHWTVLRGSPHRGECLLATLDSKDDIRIERCWQGTWSVLATIEKKARKDTRCFDLAYESTSGDALLVYYGGSDKEIYFRTWDGTALGAEQQLALPSQCNAYWIALSPHPGSDQIALVVVGDNKHLVGSIWTGGDFTETTLLEPDLFDPNTECAAAAFVQNSTALFVWSTGLGIRSRTWKAIWSELPLVVPGVPASHWLRLAAGPGASDAHLAVLQADKLLSVHTWSGGTWNPLSRQVLTAKPVSTTWRAFDLACSSYGELLVAYGEAGNPAVQSAVWTSALGWRAVAGGPVLGAEIRVVQLRPDPIVPLVHLAAGSQSATGEQLHVAAWREGWGASLQMAPTLSVEKSESFMLSPHGDPCVP